MQDEANRLLQGLRAMGPREARVLEHRVLDGQPRDACAAFLGVRPEAFDVAFARAVWTFHQEVGGPVRGPAMKPEVEAAAAEALRETVGALEAQANTSSTDAVPAEVRPLIEHVRALHALRAELRRRLAEEAAREETRARRLDWPRLLLIGIVVAIALWAMFR